VAGGERIKIIQPRSISPNSRASPSNAFDFQEIQGFELKHGFELKNGFKLKEVFDKKISNTGET